MLTMIFNYAAKHRWVDFNPAEHVDKLRKPVSAETPIDGNVLTPEEINRLLDAADGPKRRSDGTLVSNNHKLLLQVAVFTGMRAGEILGLQWGDVDWNARQIHVRRAWKEGRFYQPKTPASIRRIDLPGVMIDRLRAWKLECPISEHDLVFPNLAGNPLSHTNLLQRVFHPALRRAGLRKIRFHDLRHTFASLLIANGEDVVRVSRLLGHASPTITLRVYSHMLPKEHYGSAERLADLVNGVDERADGTNLGGSRR
jgi:integrase